MEQIIEFREREINTYISSKNKKIFTFILFNIMKFIMPHNEQ